MRRMLYHPLWVHLPAVLVLAVVITGIIQAMPLPEYGPTHFGMGGRPDSYGSPVAAAFSVVIAILLIIGLGIFIDELWARQETRKSFNWMSLFDEVTVGLLGAVALEYTGIVKLPEPVLGFAWKTFLALTVPAVALAVVLELLRPYRLRPEQIIPEEDTAIREEIGRRIESGQQWVYWETQNPGWYNVLAIVTCIFLLFAAIASWGQVPLWITGLIMVSTVMIVLPYGGLQVMVNEHRVLVKLGLVGIKLLRLQTDDIIDIEIHSFSPLQDFGGYGIRFNREMKAYFFRGNRGVKVRTIEGKQYLIGSDSPEKLAAVIKMVSSLG